MKNSHNLNPHAFVQYVLLTNNTLKFLMLALFMSSVSVFAVPIGFTPTVTTEAVSDISHNAAIANGTISNLGSPTATAHGVCWNTTGTPTIADSKTDEGAASSMGTFTSDMTGLEANTLYYVRSYATNSAGTAYGNQVSFTTEDVYPVMTESFEVPFEYSGWTLDSLDGSSSWKIFPQTKTPFDGWMSGDYTTFSQTENDGNNYAYATYKYGGSKSNDLWLISPQSQVIAGDSLTFWYGRAFINFDDSLSVYVSTTGTDIEDFVLIDTIQFVDYAIPGGGSIPPPEFKEIHWKRRAISLDAYAGQNVHFAIREHYDNNWYEVAAIFLDNVKFRRAEGLASFIADKTTISLGQSVSFENTSSHPFTHCLWDFGDGNTSTESLPNHTYTQAGEFTVTMSLYGEVEKEEVKSSYITVSPVSPSVTTTEITTFGATTATVGGEVTSDGGATVTERGVVYSITSANNNPLIDGTDVSKLVIGDGVGSFSDSVSGLTAATAYSIKAFATNSEGTSYGSQVSFTTAKQAQTITFGALDNKTYGNANFDLSATASSSLDVTYTSSDETVATISGTTVTITGAGSITIIASQTGNGTYLAATDVPQNLTVTKATLTATADNKTKVYGEDNPTLTLQYSGFVGGDDATDLTIAPSAQCEATASSSVGDVDITVAGGVDDNYAFDYAKGTLSITKADGNMNWSIANSTINKLKDDANFTLASATSTSGNVTYASSDEEVVTVDASTGEVDIVAAGLASITATAYDPDGNYTTVGKSLTISVSITVGTKLCDELTISLYPNPAQTIVHINGAADQIFDVSIYSAYGQQVLHKTNSVNTIDVSGLNPAIYFVSIAYQGQVKVLRLVKH